MAFIVLDFASQAVKSYFMSSSQNQLLYSKLIRVSELFPVIRNSLIILNSILGEATLSYGIGSLRMEKLISKNELIS